MDAGRNQSSRHDAKLLQVKDSVNPQILDYYKRFGQNRDLEQYFFSHGTGRSCTSSSMHTDATEFATARCMSSEDDHTRCQQKAIMKELISKSLDSETKKQRYSSFKSFNLDPFGQKIQVQADDSTQATGDTALINEKMAKQSSPPKDTFLTSDRSEGSIKYGGEMGDDETQLDQSATKAGSPSSSATRRLEWDSLADVGYANAELGFSEQNLSTLERIALRSRYKSRDGDKGKNVDTNQDIDIELQNVVKMGLPNAQSTPELDKDSVATTRNIKMKTIIKPVPGRKSNRKTVLKHKNTYKLDYSNNMGSTNVNIDTMKEFSLDLQKLDENNQSHPKLNTNDSSNFVSTNNNKAAESPKVDENTPLPYDITTSNDSKSTVTAETSTSNKEIQTSYRDSVSTSAQTLQTNGDGSYALSNVISKTPIILNMLRKINKPKTFSTKKRRRKEASFNLPGKLCILPDKDTVESYQSDNDFKEASVRYGPDSPTKCSESILTQAESFEYMPGNMYLNKDITSQGQSPNTESIPESSNGIDQESFPAATSSSSSSKNPADLLKCLELSNSFTRDLNSSVDIIGKLINIRHKDPELKKKLIKRVVKILVKNDYPDDENLVILPSSDNNKLVSGKTSVEKTSSDDVEKSPIGDQFNNQNVEQSENITVKPQPKLEVNILPSTRIPPVHKCLTASIPLNEKLVCNVFRQVKSAPVSLSYSDYLEHKAKSSDLDSGTKNNEIDIASESHSYNLKNVHSLFTDKDINKKTKPSMEMSGSTCTLFSSTPKVSSCDSNVDRKIMKTKSEKIYEQYLLVKKQEEDEYKQRLKNDIHRREKRELRKHDVDASLLKIHKAPSSISTNDTPKQLAVINDEILQLTILKLKLENKHIPENLDLLKGGSGRSPLTTKLLTDEGASGDRGSSSKPLSDIQDLDQPILTYYSVTNSPASPRNRKYVHVPPLNLNKSSDASCENTLSNVEELESCQYSYHKDDKVKKYVSKRATPPDSKNLVCVDFPECSKNFKKCISCVSRNNNQNKEVFQPASKIQDTLDVDDPKSSRNVNTFQRPISKISRNNYQKKEMFQPADLDYVHVRESSKNVRAFQRPIMSGVSGESKEKYHYSQKPERSHNVDGNCKCGKVCFHCQTPQNSSKTPKSSSVLSDSGKDRGTGIICPCCRSNLISSNSSISDPVKKTPRTAPDTAQELRKLEKVFEKYQKCKILQSFMKEYDDLIMKYTLMKKAKLTEHGCCPSSSESKSCKESHKHSQNESTKEPVSNESKKHPTLTSVHMVKRSMDSRESDNVMDQAKIAESTCQQKYALRQNVDNIPPSINPCTDIKITGNSDVLNCGDPTVKIDMLDEKLSFRKMLQAKNIQMAFADANTSPLVTPRPKYNYDNFGRPIRQGEKQCVDVGTSPISDREDGGEYSGSGIDCSKSSKISDNMIRKVRKAFSKEYEDIMKKCEEVKNEHCSNCKHKKSNSKDGLPKVNEVNVRESEPYMTASSRRETKSKDKPLLSKSVEDKHKKNITNTCICSICKVSPVIIGLKICMNCAKTQKGSKKNDHIREECVPRPIAYNLIVESSESILEETIQNKRSSLEEIIVKVPKLRSKSNKKNVQEALRVLMSVDEEKGSTDEQIKEFSSLNNDDLSEDSSSCSPSSCSDSSDKDNEVPSKCVMKKYNLTVGEFLQKHRPDFVSEANKRQECLKKIHERRQQREVELRKLFSLGVSCLPNLKEFKLSDLECIAKKHGIFLPKHSEKRVFDSNEMVRRTARQYMKLPEILNKKYDLKREEYKRTNLLMADLFAKKLKEKTLKGYVNISHCHSVISI